SGRNGGQMIDGFVEIEKVEKRSGIAAADTAWRMGIECRRIVVDRIEQYGIDCDLKLGYIDLALNQRDVEYFHSEIERKARLNYPHPLEFVPRERMPEYIGSQRYVGGLVNRANGHLHPL